MSTPDIISLNDISDTIDDGPKLNVMEKEDSGVIRLNNLPNIETESPMPSKSVNFGPGADLLMNPNQANKQNSPKSDIKLSDLNSLDLDSNKGNNNISKSSIFNPSFNVPSVNDNEEIKKVTEVKFDTESTANNTEPINLGRETNNSDKSETWDGFKKFNDIPVDPEANIEEKPKMTEEEKLRLKFSFIRKLEAMEKQGVSVSRKYTMDDKLEEMQGEYEMIKSEIAKKNSIKFQSKMLMAAISGIEFLNNRFDPFDIKLDGWGESVNENIDEYDEVFGELHEKYGGKTKMAPELKLLFMLGGSAAMIHMTNTMFKSAMPGMDDIMRQNPELMQQFTNAAANTMGQQNPGFGNFMSNMMPPMGAPQAPNQMRPPSPQREFDSRPDVNYARNEKQPKRAEMKGPSDIDDLLSGIKTKSINITEVSKKDDSSTISVAELKEMQKDNIQKKSRRRPKSERSTISLDI
jgi:hypothetical protein